MKKHALKIGQSPNQRSVNTGFFVSQWLLLLWHKRMGELLAHFFAGNWLSVTCTWHWWKGFSPRFFGVSKHSTPRLRGGSTLLWSTIFLLRSRI
jgi:hypothetical protein